MTNNQIYLHFNRFASHLCWILRWATVKIFGQSTICLPHIDRFGDNENTGRSVSVFGLFIASFLFAQTQTVNHHLCLKWCQNWFSCNKATNMLLEFMQLESYNRFKIGFKNEIRPISIRNSPFLQITWEIRWKLLLEMSERMLRELFQIVLWKSSK